MLKKGKFLWRGRPIVLAQSLLETSQAKLSDKPLPTDVLRKATLPKLGSEVERLPPCSCLLLFFSPHWRPHQCP